MPIVLQGTSTPVTPDALDMMGFSLYSSATTDLFQLNAASQTPFVDLDQIEGLDTPDVKTEQHDKASTHGAYVNSSWLGPRVFNLHGTLYAADSTELQGVLDRLRTIWQPTPAPSELRFRVPAGTSPDQYRRAYGFSQGLKYDVEAGIFPTKAEVSFQFLCPNPFILSQDPDIKSASQAATTTGGLTLTTNISGTAPSSGVMTLDIPSGATIINPSFQRTNLLPGETIPPIISLIGTYGPGRIEIDLTERTCYFISPTGVYTNQRGTWSTDSRWFQLGARQTNTLRYTRAGATSTGIVVFTASAESTWW